MRLTRPPTIRQFGQLQIAPEVQILDLDVPTSRGAHNDVCLSRGSLDKILSDMVMVVPCKDEALGIIRGVIAAIPAPCVVLLVSNCRRGRGEGDVEDQYTQLVDLARTFGTYGRQVLTIHQKDPAAAAALHDAGMSALLVDPLPTTTTATGDDTKQPMVIRNGKGEGMVLGIAVAAAFCPGKRYIGFVDADNFNPCSVTEYCRAFAAGFAMSRAAPEQEDTVVRLKWSSKPKIRNGRFDYVSEGRCSQVVNAWLNRLFVLFSGEQDNKRDSTTTGTTKPLITTGNAGEHAMTMALAKKLRLAAGYAIEPFHFVDLLVRGDMISQGPRDDDGVDCTPSLLPLDRPVVVRQIRTLSPHYHRDSDDEHIRSMWAAGLGCIYHGVARSQQDGSDSGARLCRDMLAYAVRHDGVDKATGKLPCPRVYPPVQTMSVARFRDGLALSLGKGSENGQTTVDLEMCSVFAWTEFDGEPDVNESPRPLASCDYQHMHR
ncbi:glycosyltransferase family 55 protein [Parathielavia hyrcaniae]|uniref:Glycosyltransferase family 55 protein n=1 Tax=Parathielavia hyrcaniae TaxID=113614 RepID=A0AAN6Q0R6_9PEZI|nr:glycosyltransferase family 55 protein [Parathielavia hyrcaniae]